MVKVYAKTIVGNTRKKNQDGFYLNGFSVWNDSSRDIYYESESNRLTAFVSDGIGSTPDGEYAVEKTIKYFIHHEKTLEPFEIGNFIDSVNSFINYCAERYNKNCAATIAGVLVKDSMTFFDVGDTKIFILNNGYLEEISRDDTAATLIRESDIDSTTLNLSAKLPLIQYLGNLQETHIDTHITQVHSLKDTLICTDGITDVLSIDDIENILNNEENIRNKVNAIINAAVTNGSQDNITAMYIKFE